MIDQISPTRPTDQITQAQAESDADILMRQCRFLLNHCYPRERRYEDSFIRVLERPTRVEIPVKGDWSSVFTNWAVVFTPGSLDERILRPGNWQLYLTTLYNTLKEEEDRREREAQQAADRVRAEFETTRYAPLDISNLDDPEIRARQAAQTILNPPQPETPIVENDMEDWIAYQKAHEPKPAPEDRIRQLVREFRDMLTEVLDETWES
jgi:hypothetical protein